MENGADEIGENLATIQKAFAAAAGEVPHDMKAEREKIRQHTADNVRIREKAVARGTRVFKRRVFKKQARKDRAEHLVKCFLAPGKRKVRGKPLSELYMNGCFTDDKEEWQRELQRHFEEVCTDQAETREVQENRIEYFKKER